MRVLFTPFRFDSLSTIKAGLNPLFQLPWESTHGTNLQKEVYTNKGTAYYVTRDHDSSRTYVIFIHDNRILDYAKVNPNKTDSFGKPFRFISQADFLNSTDRMGEYSYQYGIPNYLTYKDITGNQVSTSIFPNMIVQIFEIAHPSGNFLEFHQGQTLTRVAFMESSGTSGKLEQFDATYSPYRRMKVLLDFSFSDNAGERYMVFQDGRSNIILVRNTFYRNWKP